MLSGALVRSKLKALAMHVFVSSVLAMLVGYVVFFLWYPNPFGFASGGLQLFLLVTGVDLVLGPALTFVAFDPNKRRLLMVGDFVVIAILQISALVYGVNAVYDSRPVAVVFEVSRFRAVRAGELSSADLAKAPDGLGQLSLTGPVLMATRSLTTKEESDSIFLALEGKDIGMRPELWSPYDRELVRIKAGAKPIDALLARYPNETMQIEKLASAKNLTLRDLGFYPVLSKQGIFTMLVNRNDGRFVAYVLLDGSL